MERSIAGLRKDGDTLQARSEPFDQMNLRMVRLRKNEPKKLMRQKSQQRYPAALIYNISVQVWRLMARNGQRLLGTLITLWPIYSSPHTRTVSDLGD